MKKLIFILVFLMPLVSGLPDLEVLNLEHYETSSIGFSGQNFSLIRVYTVVRNSGSSVLNGPYSIKFEIDSIPIPINFYLAMPDLNPDEKFLLKSAFLVQIPGNYMLNLTLDPFNQVLESDENNNFEVLKLRLE